MEPKKWERVYPAGFEWHVWHHCEKPDSIVCAARIGTPPIARPKGWVFCKTVRHDPRLSLYDLQKLLLS